MAGLAAARELNASSARRAGRFDFALAGPADDAEVRALLRAHPFDGAIRITLEREPSALEAGRIEGDTHQLIVARDRSTGDLVAIGSRSTRTATVNGEPRRIGYLGALRITPTYRRHRALLESGFAYCRLLHDADPVPFYAASVVTDNSSALRLLAALPYRSAPAFTAPGSMTTMILRAKTAARASAPAGYEWRRGTSAMLPDIAACLQRHARRYQLAPWWTAGDLESRDRVRDLSPEHFVIACKGGRIAGCAAMWDQRAFKQAVVRGYSGALGRWRRMINMTAPLTRTPMLPPPGHRLESVFMSHVALDDDCVDVGLGLVAEVARLAPPGVDQLVAGVPAGTLLSTAIARRFRPRRYESTILLGAWPDGDAMRRRLDGRPFWPEVALL